MPEKETRRVGSATDSSRSTATDSHQHNGLAGLAAWKRRHAAAHRSEPLDCGCRDPWTCRCTEPPLSDHAIDGWRDAALRLLFDGQVPILPLEVRRALWRRGGPDRVLAEQLHQACGGRLA